LSKYVVLKITTGETIIAELLVASHHSVIVRRPVQVRLVPSIKDGSIAEEPVISIYCSFTYDEQFEFKNDNVVYCKPLIEKIIPFYEKTAAGLYEVQVVSVNVKDYNGGIEPLLDEETFTENVVKTKIVH
jgi:hypothetical protein